MKQITDEHVLYTANKDDWAMIDNICDGKNLKQYLRVINPDDTSTENTALNTAYYNSAVFYGITGHTSRGMTGLSFMKNPTLEVPPLMDTIKTNIDGCGTTIYQQAKALLKSVIRKGRAGLWVDFPKIDSNAVSLQRQLSGEVFPVIHHIEAEQIINWSIASVGATVKLSRVVISDSIETDGALEKIIFELLLVEGLYILKEWKIVETEWAVVKTSEPMDGSGKRLNFIPFIFIGSENNTYTIDYSPLLGMTRIEKGHYNNSAEYEDITFNAGQPQPCTKEPLDEASYQLLSKSNLKVGCRRLMPIPIEYAQMNEVTSAKEGMVAKEEKMLALGAMMIQPGSANKTATQSAGEMQTNYSVLSLCVSNVNDGYRIALGWYALFQNVPGDSIVFEINTDFIPKVADAQLITAIMNGYLQGSVTREAWIRFLQRYNIEDPEKKVEDISEELGELQAMPNLDQIEG